jgi:hypothetical protein
MSDALLRTMFQRAGRTKGSLLRKMLQRASRTKDRSRRRKTKDGRGRRRLVTSATVLATAVSLALGVKPMGSIFTMSVLPLTGVSSLDLSFFVFLLLRSCFYAFLCGVCVLGVRLATCISVVSGSWRHTLLRSRWKKCYAAQTE